MHDFIVPVTAADMIKSSIWFQTWRFLPLRLYL